MIMQNLRFALLLAACLATACTQEIVETATLTISAQPEADGAGTAPLTRTVLNEGNGVSFVSTDKLAVFDGTKVREFKALNVYSDGSAEFSGPITTPQDHYYAVYPSSAGLALEGDKVLVRIPNVQTATAGSFDPAANVSIGRTDFTDWYNHKLTLKNVCSLVKFSVPEGKSYAAAVLMTGSDAVLTGDLFYTMEDVPAFYNADDDYQTASVTLKGNITGGHWYYIAVNPCTLEGGFALYFYDSEEALAGGYYATYKNTDKDVTLGRSKILNLGVVEGTGEPYKPQGWYGSGTESDPYLLGTVEDLELFLQRLADDEDPTYRDKFYTLTADIDCGGKALIEDDKEVEFCGTFNGNGHTISNYLPSTNRIPDERGYFVTYYQYRALFHKVYRATFKDLTLRPAALIQASFDLYSYVSPFIALVQYSDSSTTIEGCRLEGPVEISFNLYENSELVFGGFVADNSCDALYFKNCTNNADFTFSEYRYEEWDEEMHCYEHTIEDGTNYRIGGFVGEMYCSSKNSTTSFDRCRNNGDITFQQKVAGSEVHCGGFAGYGHDGFAYASTVSFTNCVNSGNITAEPGDDCSSVYSAGFFAFDKVNGKDRDGKIKLANPRFYNCLNKGSITANGKDAHAAGIAFCDNRATEFALCVNIGTLSASVPGGTSGPYVAAISCGNGTLNWCWWLEKDKNHPVLKCTLSGKAKNCYCYPTLNADTPNNRRTGSNGKGGKDEVLTEKNTQWTSDQWRNNTVAWTGGSKYGQENNTLDLDF